MGNLPDDANWAVTEFADAELGDVRRTKRLALALHAEGATVEAGAQALETSPSYVANVIAAAGQIPDYQDLYVSTAALSGYAQRFRGVLRFTDVAAARASVQQLDERYHAFAQQQDRRGQHQAQLLALIGKNRAEGLGKYAEARVFAEWLIAHLAVPQDPPPPVVRRAEAKEAACTNAALSCGTVPY